MDRSLHRSAYASLDSQTMLRIFTISPRDSRRVDCCGQGVAEASRHVARVAADVVVSDKGSIPCTGDGSLRRGRRGVRKSEGTRESSLRAGSSSNACSHRGRVQPRHLLVVSDQWNCFELFRRPLVGFFLEVLGDWSLARKRLPSHHATAGSPDWGGPELFSRGRDQVRVAQ